MEKILLVFKDKKKVTKNHEFWNDKLSLKYSVENFFIEDYLNHTNLQIVQILNEIILKNNFKYTAIEGDHNSIIDKLFIDKITDKTIKGIFLGDDNEWHDVNKINSFSCDFVLTACPISALRFKEYGVKTLFVPIEANGNIWKDYNLKKDIDILFFGRTKKIRQQYFDLLLKNNINVLIVDPYNEISDTNIKLAQLINRSKIVLNFSASGRITRFWNRNKVFDYCSNFKGRIYMTSFCNSLCITEQDPAASLIFSDEELPQFENIEECTQLVTKFLNDNNLLQSTTKKFFIKGQNYLDSNYVNKIENFLSSIKFRNKKNIILQYWYLFIHLQQSYRLRFKKRYYFSMIKQFFENFIIYKELVFKDYILINFISSIIFLRFLLFLPFKIFKK
tara:strand:- start:115 stop:1287 length:1173 start_codon:yes stop_codon:yes gene_type:complete